MKKTLLTLVAALAVLCCFIGCGGTNTFAGTYWIPEASNAASYDAYVEAEGPVFCIAFDSKTKCTVDGDPLYKYSVTKEGVAEIKADLGLAGDIAGVLYTLDPDGTFKAVGVTVATLKKVNKN